MFKEERGSAPLGVRDGRLDMTFKMENKGRVLAKLERQETKGKATHRR